MPAGASGCRDRDARAPAGAGRALVLGIETSCDETAAAVVSAGRTVLSSVVASQAEMHARYGGVVPEIASRRHVEDIAPVVSEALRRAGVGGRDLAAVAVTNGPGLIGSLMVGLSFAKSLAFAHSRPLVGVNHVLGHVYAGFLGDEPPGFPFLALVVSGGHSDLILFRDHQRQELIGQTRDDAAGEAFDKVARILGLGYPGGPAIDKLSRQGLAGAIRWPTPRLSDAGGRFDFSFSGIKTAVLYYTRKLEAAGAALPVADVAASFQDSVARALAGAAVDAAVEHGIRQIVLAGGVAANSALRQAAWTLGAEQGIRVIVPEPRLCTDNAAMIAAAGYFSLGAGRTSGLDLGAYSRS
jgi:N6-L-threonylcarbamoyladenine synthase